MNCGLGLSSLLHLGLSQFSEELSDHIYTLTSKIRSEEYWRNFTLGYCFAHLINLLLVSNDLWDLSTMDLKDLCDLFEIVLKHFCWCKINLGKYYKNWDLERIGDTDMLLGHFGYSHVGSDDQDAIVRVRTGQTMHGGLQVLLMTTKI